MLYTTQQRESLDDAVSGTGVRAMSAKAALGRQFFDESADDIDQDTSNDDQSVERSYVHGSNSSLEPGMLCYIYFNTDSVVLLHTVARNYVVKHAL
jgi:hypothetical protein